LFQSCGKFLLALPCQTALWSRNTPRSKQAKTRPALWRLLSGKRKMENNLKPEKQGMYRIWNIENTKI